MKKYFATIDYPENQSWAEDKFYPMGGERPSDFKKRIFKLVKYSLIFQTPYTLTFHELDEKATNQMLEEFMDNLRNEDSVAKEVSKTITRFKMRRK